MPTKPLNWQESTLMMCLGYLANPNVNTHIEVELHPKQRKKFESAYRSLTGKPLKYPGDKKPYYVWGPNANKYGGEFRVYYEPGKECPSQLRDITVSARGPAGKKRINRKELVIEMFKYGFDFGKNDIDLIFNRILGYRNEFRLGYDLVPNPQCKLLKNVTKKSIGPPPSFGKRTYVRTPANRSYTYVFHYSNLTIWKIGYSDDLENRLQEINTHLPKEYTGDEWTLENYQEWPTADDAYNMEQTLLELLKDYRGDGERVFCPRELLMEMWNKSKEMISSSTAND